MCDSSESEGRIEILKFSAKQTSSNQLIDNKKRKSSVQYALWYLVTPGIRSAVSAGLCLMDPTEDTSEIPPGIYPEVIPGNPPEVLSKNPL